MLDMDWVAFNPTQLLISHVHVYSYITTQLENNFLVHVAYYFLC